NMIEYRRKSGWKRIGRKAGMAGETAREIAALAAGGENAGQPWLRDLPQASAAGQPHAGDDRRSACFALAVDRMLVQQHLDFHLPALPRPRVAAARKKIRNG